MSRLPSHPFEGTRGIIVCVGQLGWLPKRGGLKEDTGKGTPLFLVVVVSSHARLTVPIISQVAEAEAGATGAVGAEEDLEAEAWAGAAEAEAEAPWESTQRTKRTFTKRR